MDTKQTHLGAYLNDHLAGATTALEVLDTLAKHRDPALASFVEELRAAITDDREQLLGAMRAAGIGMSGVRQAVAWLGERAAALKVRLDDPADRGLRTFELLELVALGIDGKRALWAALRMVSETPSLLGEADLARLAQRADDQRAAVEVHRLRYARIALSGHSA